MVARRKSSPTSVNWMPRCSTSVLSPRLTMCSSFKSLNQIFMIGGESTHGGRLLLASPRRARVAKSAAMKLYTYYRSTAAFRVRIALNVKGVPYEPISLHLRTGEHQTDEYRQVNPQGLIPALDDDGVVISQS